MSHIKGYLQFISEQTQGDINAAEIKKKKDIIKGLRNKPGNATQIKTIERLEQEIQDLKAEAAANTDAKPAANPTTTTVTTPAARDNAKFKAVGQRLPAARDNAKFKAVDTATTTVVEPAANPAAKNPAAKNPAAKNPDAKDDAKKPDANTAAKNERIQAEIRKRRASRDFSKIPQLKQQLNDLKAKADVNPPTTTVTNPADAKPNTTTVTNPPTTTVTTPADAKPAAITVTKPATITVKKPVQMSSGRGNEALRARNIAKAKARKQNPTVNTKPTLNKAGTDSGSGVDALKQRMIKRSEERGK